jgi:hypothetical protein
VICPFAVQKPISVNHGGTRSAHLGLVIHVQQGNGSLFGFFDNPSAQVSAHFWCAKDGTLEQYLDTSVVAWAEANGNDSYTSCEFEGFDTEAMTGAQLATGARLADWLSAAEGWPVTGPVAHGQRGITPHANPDGTPDPSWGNHPCPGSIRIAQIPTIVTLAAAPPEPPSKEENETVTSLVQGGQLHVWGVVNNVAYHWWQEIVSPSGWHTERLPT